MVRVGTVLVASLLVASACASVRIDDRLSYRSAAAIDAEFAPQPRVAVVVDSASEALVVSKRPSGIVGAVGVTRFPVGATFGAYVQQYRERVFRLEAADTVRVRLAVRRWDVDHAYSVNSALAGSSKQKRVAMPAEIAASYERAGAAVRDTVYAYAADGRSDTQAAGATGSEASADAIDAVVRQLMRDVVRDVDALRRPARGSAAGRGAGGATTSVPDSATPGRRGPLATAVPN